MSRYTNIKVNITERQKQLLQNALQANKPISIRFSYDDLCNDGNDILALTNSQKDKIKKAYENGKGVTIKLSKQQLAHNMKVEGGFLATLAAILPMLAKTVLPAIAKNVLPALGVGALSGLASTGVQKALGKGLYLKKGGCVCQLETDGKGLYLGQAPSKTLKSVGDGLYLKSARNTQPVWTPGQYDGKGLLLGPDSPFKNIPFLNILL